MLQSGGYCLSTVYTVTKWIIVSFPTLARTYILRTKVGIFLHDPQHRRTPCILWARSHFQRGIILDLCESTYSVL